MELFSLVKSFRSKIPILTLMFRKYPSDPLPQVPAPDAAVDTLLRVQLLGSFLKPRHVLFTLWLLREGAVVEREEGLPGD